MISRILFLIRHEARLEFRQQHTLVGIALFALSTVYLCYQAFRKLDAANVWNALLWVILLFTAFSAVGKSFQGQSRGLRLYLFWNIKPQEFIVAKIVYNILLMIVLTILAFGAYALFIGTVPLRDGMLWPYLLGLIFGGAGFATLLTLISAIAGQSESGAGLTAILGIPIAIPLILLLNQYNSNVLKGVPFSENAENLLFISVLTIGIFSLSYLLFPYLWRD